MTELDLDAIRARHEAVYATSTYPALLAATSRAIADVPTLLALVAELRAELDEALHRADNLESERDRVLDVCEQLQRTTAQAVREQERMTQVLREAADHLASLTAQPDNGGTDG